MDWSSAASALVGAVSGAIVAMTPSLYRLLSGRAQAIREEHALVVAELHQELDRVTTRLDKRIEHDEKTTERLLVVEKHAAECDARLAEQEQVNRHLQAALDHHDETGEARIAALESEVEALKKIIRDSAGHK